MKKILIYCTGIFVTMLIISGCDVIKGLPTNTSGGLFSLNGNWRMESSDDNNALAGTSITVYPIAGNGTITTIQNNTYCIRENDVLWKSITSNKNGAFTISNLVNSCSSSLTYKPATITVITNDEVRLSGTRANGASLVQTWRRVVK